MNKQNKDLWVLGHRVKYINTEGNYGLLVIKSDPEIPGPPPHYHRDSSELFYIIDGQMDVMIEGNWQTIGAGSSLTVPRGKVHTFMNRGNTTANWITAFSPRGFEKFFLDFGVPIELDNSFESSTSSEIIEKVIAKAETYDMIIKSR